MFIRGKWNKIATEQIADFVKRRYGHLIKILSVYKLEQRTHEEKNYIFVIKVKNIEGRWEDVSYHAKASIVNEETLRYIEKHMNRIYSTYNSKVINVIDADKI